jgi:hypothetical protein
MPCLAYSDIPDAACPTRREDIGPFLFDHNILTNKPAGNLLDVRFRFGSAPPKFQDLADSGSVRTELREHYGPWVTFSESSLSTCSVTSLSRRHALTFYNLTASISQHVLLQIPAPPIPYVQSKECQSYIERWLTELFARPTKHGSVGTSDGEDPGGTQRLVVTCGNCTRLP